MNASATALSDNLPGRISDEEALALYHESSIHDLGRQAHAITMQLHPEPYRTYIVDRNINYSNYCTANCAFCNFSVDPHGTQTRNKNRPDGYILTFEEIGRKIEELIAIGGAQILMQGGLVPPEILPFQWYLDLLRFIKREYPAIHVHAFSPPEVHAFHEVFEMPVRDVLLRLQEAGLDTIPGGGAEILVDRVRRKTAPGKCTTDQYLEVMRQAHRIGMRTTATMMFGHVETIPERIEHLRQVRELQDETGGFTAFICWTFQPGGTALGQVEAADPAYCGPRDGQHLMLAGACDYLCTLALARVYLDNIRNIQASWVTQGVKVGQLALLFGANDMGSLMMEENVVSSAGVAHRVCERQIRDAIEEAGWQPRKRNCFYELAGNS